MPAYTDAPDGRKRRINAEGYVSVRRYDGDGDVLEHIEVMERHLGRALEGNEVVHHRDEVRHNNDIGNLEVMDRGEHSRLHNTGRKHISLSLPDDLAGLAAEEAALDGISLDVWLCWAIDGATRAKRRKREMAKPLDEDEKELDIDDALAYIKRHG